MAGSLVQCIDKCSVSDFYESDFNDDLTISVTFRPGDVYESYADPDDEAIIHVITGSAEIQLMRRFFNRHFQPFGETFDDADIPDV